MRPTFPAPSSPNRKGIYNMKQATQPSCHVMVLQCQVTKTFCFIGGASCSCCSPTLFEYIGACSFRIIPLRPRTSTPCLVCRLLRASLKPMVWVGTTDPIAGWDHRSPTGSSLYFADPFQSTRSCLHREARPSGLVG